MRVFGYDIRLRKNSDKKRTKHREVDFFAPRSCMYEFAESEVLDCQKMISSRLSNVCYHAKIDFITTNSIFKFLDSNRLQIVRRLFFDGFLIINTDTMEFVDTSYRQSVRSFDGKITFELCENEILHVSETYEATGFSDYHFLDEKLRFLNVVNSSDRNLIENYGAMGIVSPESDNSIAGAEFSENDIRELQERYSRSYGIILGKWSLMFVPKPTKYSKIDLPISQLQLSDKRLYLLKAIYAAFGIPKEISVYFESSKYANRNEAELDFYSSTIKTWADVLINIAYKIYANLRQTEPYLLPNEFWYDFTGVYALQEAQRTEKESAREELRFWQEVLTSMPEHAETASMRIENLIESL